jgi:two-component system cell cycle response regulator
MSVQDPSAAHDVLSPGGDTPGPVAAPAVAGALASGEADRLRVLVVDDEPTLRTVIAQVLRLDGFDATEADSAEQALVEFRARPFPVVITDIVMGGMSGLELLRELKAIDPETMVVVMTSQASLEAATTALRGGAYDFLVKPFEDLILVSAVVQRAGEALALQARNRLLSSQLEVYARELERLNVSLKDMADRDWLTGLANRRRLRSVLDSEVSRATRHGLELSILMLDVDHFKALNDRLGHGAGDIVLRELAEMLQGSVRAEDLCARYGGEEFVVLLPGAGRSAALACAEAIRCQAEHHPFADRANLPGGALTVSLGIASFPADGHDGEALLNRADGALYLAKEGGRNRVEG